jgi:hypothetical protein
LENKKLNGLKYEKLEALFHKLLAFGVIQLLDLTKANPQKYQKAETNTPLI